MKNKLKKWPRNWIEHVTETCFFYFENNNILFIDSKIFYLDKTKKEKPLSIKLTFKKQENIYDIFINHEESSFIINYYYKEYYRIRRKRKFEQDFISLIGTWLKGSDNIGLFSYSDLGGETSRENIISPYDISQSIESTINYHNDKNDNDDNDRGDGENDPIEPFSPCNTIKPELLNC